MSEGQKPIEKVAPVLRDLLSIFDIVTSNRYMTLADQDEINIYVTYMTYRVQQDLYQVCQESGLLCGLSWDEFVLLMRGYKSARTAAMAVVRETLKVYAAFQDALAKLDFKPVWKSERLEELVSQTGQPEVQPNG